VTNPATSPSAIELPVERQAIFDPPAELSALREQRPLCRLKYRSGEVGWLVTSYELARAVMTDARFILGGHKAFPIQDQAQFTTLVETFERMGGVASLLLLDAPDHMRIRRLLVGDFSVSKVGELKPHINRIVEERLDAMEQAGPPVDLVKEFAEPVALLTHCALLGLPEQESVRLSTVNRAVTDPDSPPASVEAAILECCDYLTSLFARKRAEPQDDLLSRLLASEELTEGELLSLTVDLFNAGVDTVVTMLASGPFALLCHPDQMAALQAEPDSIDLAVEELMRYLTVFKVGALTRTAREDIELEGETIRAGECVTVSLAAANRDPARFEEPDVLDLDRSARGQMGFGHGPHVCLGQHLARLEMRVGIGELLRRFPTLRLAVPAEEIPVAGNDRLIFSVMELPVAW
jgi:cytochrome P450